MRPAEPRREHGQPLVCPRCGYDLSGLTTAPTGLAAAQPLGEGTCPECGLGFAWIDVLDPARNDVSWLYEHTPGRGIGLIRAWGTLRRAALPWQLWGGVRLTARVSIARLFLWPAVLVLPLHLLWAGSNFSRQVIAAGRTGAITGTALLNMLGATAAYPLVRFDFGPVAALGPWTVEMAEPDSSFLVPLGATVLAPVMILILARTRATSRVRTAHILRAGIYAAGWFVGWYALWTGLSVASFVAEWAGWRGPWPLNPWLRARWQSRIVTGGVGLCLLWFGCYWWFALSKGMRLKRAGIVWFLLMVACLLMGLNVARLDPSFVHELGRALFF